MNQRTQWINLYEDNGHDRAKLKTIADSYTPPTAHRPKEKKDKSKKQKTPESPDDQAKMLFRALPFRSEEDIQE